MKTKKLFITAILTVAMPLAAYAQTHLKKSTTDFLNSNTMNEYISSRSTEKGEDYSFSITYFSIPESKSAPLRQIMKAFEQDDKEAYGHFSKDADKASNASIWVAYGKENQQSVRFGTRQDHHYKASYFRDNSNKDFRTIYALVWNDKKDGTISGSLWIIYGKEPKKSTAVSVWSSNDFKQLKELKNIDWSAFSFSIPDSVRSSKEFLSRFGSLQELYKNAEKEQDGNLYRTSMASKIMLLCKSGGQNLNPDEKKFVVEHIIDLKKCCYDNDQKGLSDLAIKYLK